VQAGSLGYFPDHVVPNKPPLILTPEQVLTASQHYPQGPNQCIKGAVAGVGEELAWSVLLGPATPLDMMMAAYIGCMTSRIGGGGPSSSGSGGDRIIEFTTPQLSSKFKHAPDFGVTGNWNKENAAAFQKAIEDHINAPGTKVIQGELRHGSSGSGYIPVLHYVDPTTGLNVVTDLNGNFITGFKLNADQLQYVLTTGRLGGG
jgi:hypothetical protein